MTTVESIERSRFFFFNDTATTEIYTLSLHDALPILRRAQPAAAPTDNWPRTSPACANPARRSEEHTSELQSQSNLVCRLLLEKKKKNIYKYIYILVNCTTNAYLIAATVDHRHHPELF